MRDGKGIGKGISILLSAPVDAGKILLDEDRQFTASAKIHVTVYADLLTIRPGPSHFSGHDDLYMAGRSLDIETRPVAISRNECKLIPSLALARNKLSPEGDLSLQISPIPISKSAVEENFLVSAISRSYLLSRQPQHRAARLGLPIGFRHGTRGTTRSMLRSRSALEKCNASTESDGVSVMRMHLKTGWLLFAATLRTETRTLVSG